ncbi:MAG: hypothetical protein WBA12_09875 [Catalinimonas sp.]
MRLFFCAALFSALSVTPVFAQGGEQARFTARYFFKPRPVARAVTFSQAGFFDLKPLVVLPAAEMYRYTPEVNERSREFEFFPGVGLGITVQNSVVRDEYNYARFGITPIILYVTGNTVNQSPVDLSVGSSVGFFNNHLQIGYRYLLSEMEDRQRMSLTVGLALNLTQNVTIPLLRRKRPVGIDN